MGPGLAQEDRRMPALGGILESSLYVDDLERSAQFYETIFGFQRIDSGPRLCAMSVGGKQILLLFKKGASIDHDGDGQLHLAFSIAASELPVWEQWLTQHGVAIESRQSWQRGGQSLYFRDPDQHLLEVATPGIWSIY
jgi:catechol 2,3-dioxygenase-like lactoylglutathione lyase family enzyme